MLSDIRILPHFALTPGREQEQLVEMLADAVRRQHPEMTSDEQFRKLVPDSLHADGHCLVLDDLSEIQMQEHRHEFLPLQDRARLRAGNGDLVVSVSPETKGYEDYCRQHLQLGLVEWLRPVPTANPLQIAHACWEDRAVRHELLHRLRSDKLHYVHPHMGTLGVWELAALLNQHSRRPIRVIGPLPWIAKFANNKIAFADVVRRLLGPRAVPGTMSAWNMATLSQRITEFSEKVRTVGVKRPDSAGGVGIIVVPMEQFRRKSLHEVHDILVRVLAPLHWDDGCEMLIGAWESDVLCSPSVQTWIPPQQDGPPVIEGIFSQQMKQGTQEFDGTCVVSFPEHIMQELATQSWVLARLYQRLGYIGRCSFDTILAGDSIDDARIEFIECNGRWGGTSVPMTLMNRLFGDWQQHPFAVRSVRSEGLNQLSFSELLDSLERHVYDARTGHGRLVFFTPGRLQSQSGITVLATSENSAGALELLATTVPELFKQAATRKMPG